MLLNPNGLFFVKAIGIAIPIMNKNDGKIKSAGVTPFHYAWSRYQGGDGELSTRIIPTIVSPRRISRDVNLYGTDG